MLWFDPHPTHNNLGRDLLRAAAADYGDCGEAFREGFVEVQTLDGAWTLLSATDKFDLVISHWGHGMCADGRANGEELLRRVAGLRAGGITAPPVVIFAGGDYEAVNRRQALGLGAVEFVSRWEDLIAVLESVLGETFSGRGSGVSGGVAAA